MNTRGNYTVAHSKSSLLDRHECKNLGDTALERFKRRVLEDQG